MVDYVIDASARRRHSFAVELRIAQPASPQLVSLPVWIPGSYLVREFARHVSHLEAEQDGRAVVVEPVDKASWRVRCAATRPLVVRYRVHAFDVSVRAAWLDETRGFFNGTSVFLRAHGREAEAHRVEVRGLGDGWSVATAMRPRDGAGTAHAFVADGYDELVDHPFELGRFWRGTFSAGGVPHAFAVAGALPDFDGERLLADTRRVCEKAIALWHGPGGKPPFSSYLFILNAVDEGRGGLEHRASAALIAGRRDLPRRGVAETSDGWVGVLGLIGHEYFHAWNVKRLKPRDFASLDYTRENYTELLWFFEGFTSYYDDLLLVRGGLIDADRYFKLVARTMTTVAATPGRAVQSVADASRDAWVKYYRPDENTPNATVSYYAKGSLVALALDLALRQGGAGTLDDVLRTLWRKSDGGPIDEAAIADTLDSVGGRSFANELAGWVHGTVELPLGELLESVGVALERQPATLAQRLGVRANESALTGVKLSHVLAGGAGERAGLAAGDEVIAAGEWRLRRLDDAWRCVAARGAPVAGTPSGSIDLLIARDQHLQRLTVEVDSASQNEGAVQLRQRADAPAAARERLATWLAG